MHGTMQSPVYVLTTTSAVVYVAFIRGASPPPTGPGCTTERPRPGVAPRFPGRGRPYGTGDHVGDGHGRHHRDARDLIAVQEFQSLIAAWTPLQRSAKTTHRAVLARLATEVTHLQSLPRLLTPRQARHDAGGIMIRGRAA
jgi:hypothetical protein